MLLVVFILATLALLVALIVTCKHKDSLHSDVCWEYDRLATRLDFAEAALQEEKLAHGALKVRNRETIDRFLKAKETIRKYQSHGLSAPGVDIPTQRLFAATCVGSINQHGEYRYSFICARST
jgi:hypothetical protein